MKFAEELDNCKTHDDALEAIELVFRANKKSLFFAYMLFLILGFVGVHRLYVGDTKAAFILIGLLLLWFLPPAIFGAFDRSGDTLLWVPICAALVFELFYLPILVRKKNAQIRKEIENLSTFV